jgi:putative hydrolase of the HAD superfamily
MGLPLDWQQIQTVMLDMDGTLLDLNFDNHFWQSHVPQCYAAARGLSLESGREELMARYHACAGTLEWYSVDFWEAELELDIMQLKDEVAHLIAIHPHVVEFLTAARAAGKRLVLVTNAHDKSLMLKMTHTGLHRHFDALYSAHSFGIPKEDIGFWERLRQVETFDPATTLLVDDNLAVLDSARDYGIAHLVAVSRPDTQQPRKETGAYAAISDFSALNPG